jgi:ATP-dependent RNA helicase DeaD
MSQESLFKKFNLKAPLFQAVEEAGFTIPSPIQEQAIPIIMSGRDLIGQAQTGTGKTAAFGLPALDLIHDMPNTQILVMTPTRELALQVSDELFKLGRYLGIKTAIICGGKSFKAQTDAVKRGTQVIVATPGRLLDLLESDRLPEFTPSIVILDEADEMLDMGFLEDIKKIFTFLPVKRQTLMFSATMPQPIKQLAAKILNNPAFVSVTTTETTNKDIRQTYYVIREDERDSALVRLLDCEDRNKSIIFCRTKKDVDRVTSLLVASGFQARGLHGDMEQPQREEVIRSFRSQNIHILVATDVASRGLNVSEISHVFNYHMPFDSMSYVHRIGRTGRAGNKGLACTFVTQREYRDFARYEKAVGAAITRHTIPTLDDVKKMKRHKLVTKLLEQPVHDETHEMLGLLKDVDYKEMTTRLLSFILSKQQVEGPDQIGLEQLDLPERSPHPRRRNAASFQRQKSFKGGSKFSKRGR